MPAGRAMMCSDPTPLILRTYREGSAFQWLREVIVNAKEAHASDVEIGIEPEGIEHGFHRMAIYDNGDGIDGRQINGGTEFERFLFTYGGGGKPIGEAYENFGIGMKSTLLPWNTKGVVVVSVKNGLAAMAWLQGVLIDKDGKTALSFQARTWETEDNELASVIEPCKLDDCDIDFEKAIPSFIGVKDDKGIWVKDGELAHGTVIILLGSEDHQDTILGDMSLGREECGTANYTRKQYAELLYVSGRFWDLDGLTIHVKMPTIAAKDGWPHSRQEFESGKRDGSVVCQRRRVPSAKDCIFKPYGIADDRLAEVQYGTIKVPGPLPAKIHWFLRPKDFIKETDKGSDKPWLGGDYSHSNGYVGVLYRNEIYERRNSRKEGALPIFNGFGVRYSNVQRRLFLIIEAQEHDQDHWIGVYPQGSRSQLRCNMENRVNHYMPWDEWGNYFAQNMPDEIKQAIKEADQAGYKTDFDASSEIVEKLALPYADRFPALEKNIDASGSIDNLAADKLRSDLSSRKRPSPNPDPNPDPNPSPDDKPDRPDKPKKPRVPRMLAIDGGDCSGAIRRSKGTLPDFKWTSKDDGFEAEWFLARYDKDENKIYLNLDSVYLEDAIAYFSSGEKYNAEEGQVADAVRNAVAASMRLRVAHILSTKRLMVNCRDSNENEVDFERTAESMLSSQSLTASMLGYYDIDRCIDPMLRGFKAKRPKSPSEDQSSC